MADLSTTLLGLTLRNPIMPAAGPPGRDGAALLACAAGGAGALVAKTISTRAAQPPTPNMAEIQHGMVNTELWSEMPPERWLETEYALARTSGLPLIVSLGYTPDEIAELAPKVAPYADAVELSTHYVGTDPEPMTGAIRAAKAALKVPVLVKLSPHGEDMAGAARAAADAGADGIVAINSFGPVLSIDIETATPRLGRRERLWLDQWSGAQAARRALRARHLQGGRSPGHRSGWHLQRQGRGRDDHGRRHRGGRVHGRHPARPADLRPHRARAERVARRTWLRLGRRHSRRGTDACLARRTAARARRSATTATAVRCA